MDSGKTMGELTSSLLDAIMVLELTLIAIGIAIVIAYVLRK